MTDVVMPALRGSAKVLLLHGFGGSLEKAWRPSDRALIAAFLELSENKCELGWERSSGTYLGYLEHQHNGRRVVFERALNGAVNSDYIAALRSLTQTPRPACAQSRPGGQQFERG